ncbi:MAG TPA: primosomal protein N' [Clostridia bacterium]|nr:primosomal protein N' [Clostridia bacterium]
MYAEVIVGIQARRLDRVFHYRIPLELANKTALGSQVIIPFGHKKVSGIVVGFTEKPDVNEDKLKEIISVKDSEPILNAELLMLAKWMSEKYGALLIDCLRCIMPAGIEIKMQEKYCLGPGVNRQSYELLAKSDPDLVKVVKILLDYPEKEIDYKKLLKLSDDEEKTRNHLKKLIRMGLVQKKQQSTSALKPKTERLVSLTSQGQALTEEEGASLLKFAPKQLELFNYLKYLNKPVLFSVLDSKFKGGLSSAIKSLEKKNLVKIESKVVFRDPLENVVFPPSVPPELTEEQKMVVEEITDKFRLGGHGVFLLHGVTGSGKTEVYMRIIEQIIKLGKQVIVLVPEIALTSQMIERLYGRFQSQLAVLHSGLSTGERYDEWRKIRLNKSKIIVGARSAVFAPVQKLGLIILDEEHESTYKQSDSIHYHAREVAIKRAELNQCPVILGSATPSVESYYLARNNIYGLHTMTKRVGKSLLPKVKIIDMREELKSGNRTIFSRELQIEMDRALREKEQIILFINRRGFSTFLLCRECGYTLTCKNCDVALTYHFADKILRCHYCGYLRPAPSQCPSCGGGAIRHFGTGTQRVEEEVKKLYPTARVERLDLDSTTRKGSHEQILNRFKRGETDILVGTQMVAKGLDFPKVSLVGVVVADTALNFPDFRAAERTFQLLTQVAGRAGRGDKEGRVIIQTYNPDHYSITTAAKHDYLSFYQQEIKIRKQLNYPPFTQLVRILISGKIEEGVAKLANDLAFIIKNSLSEKQELLGPSPAPLLKVREKFRWHMILKGKNTNDLLALVKKGINQVEKNKLIGNNQIVVDINPQDML